MAIFRIVVLLLVVALLNGCATPKQWSAIGETRAGRTELVIEPTPNFFCKLDFVYWLVAFAKNAQSEASFDEGDSSIEPLLQRLCDLSADSNQ